MPLQGTHLPIPVGFDWLQTAVRGFLEIMSGRVFPVRILCIYFLTESVYGGKNQDGR